MLPRAMPGHALLPCRASELTMSASSFASYQSYGTATTATSLRAENEALRQENLSLKQALQTYQDAVRAARWTLVGVDEANAQLNLPHQLQALRRTAQLPPVDSVAATASSGDSSGYTLGPPAPPARAASHRSPSLRTPQLEQRVVPVWVEPSPEPSSHEGPDDWVPPPPEGPPPEQGGGVPVVVPSQPAFRPSSACASATTREWTIETVPGMR